MTRLFIASLSFLLLLYSHDALGREYVWAIDIDLPDLTAQPTDEEFVIAAKKTFFKRDFVYVVIGNDVIRGTSGDFSYEIRRESDGFRVVWVGGELRARKMVDTHVRNFARDFTLELAEYLL